MLCRSGALKGVPSPTVGGSNRTLIKHAQQLITHPKYGLGNCEVGTLVTLDRSYELLEELIPTSWRSEVTQVADRYGADSVEVQVMKVTALCVEIPALPLTAENITALLHPDVAGESRRDDINAALARLVSDDRLRETDDGYKLQSPEQKDWEQTRRGFGLTHGVRRSAFAASFSDRPWVVSPSTADVPSRSTSQSTARTSWRVTFSCSLKRPLPHVATIFGPSHASRPISKP